MGMHMRLRASLCLLSFLLIAWAHHPNMSPAYFDSLVSHYLLSHLPYTSLRHSFCCGHFILQYFYIFGLRNNWLMLIGSSRRVNGLFTFAIALLILLKYLSNSEVTFDHFHRFT